MFLQHFQLFSLQHKQAHIHQLQNWNHERMMDFPLDFVLTEI